MRAATRGHPDDIAYPSSIGFLLIHVGCFAAVWTGITWRAAAIAAMLYLLRMFTIGAGYHRYFAHRAFSTGRICQFALAFLAQTSAQRGILWWASKHRRHHRYSDTVDDVHSPVQHSFLYAHLGWIFVPRNDETDYAAVRDLARYQELVWLDRHPYLPAALLASATWLAAGWSGLAIGFCWSTVAVWHATFCIQLARSRRRSAALRHRRPVEKQLGAGTADDGRRLAQQPPRLSGIGETGIPLVGV